jgi:mannose-1-phosphate guanylyltransferase
VTKYGWSVLPAMVLAAGLGTRLRPLTDECPKPLVPVGDRSVLAHAIGRMRAGGIARFVVNAHHLPDAVRAAASGLGAQVSVESDLLGTAGAVGRARELLGDGAVVLWNGDVVADVDVAGLVRAHESLAPEATLAVMPRARGEGNVGLDDEGRVVRLRRESVGTEARSGDFACVHVLGEGLRGGLPERGCLVGDVYIPALRKGATLRAVEHVGPWHDIGSVGSYLDANTEWLRARSADMWTGVGVTVASEVAVDGSVLCAGATVVGAGRLSRCVVWEGATAIAPIDDAVILRGRVVRRS